MMQHIALWLSLCRSLLAIHCMSFINNYLHKRITHITGLNLLWTQNCRRIISVSSHEEYAVFAFCQICINPCLLLNINYIVACYLI